MVETNMFLILQIQITKILVQLIYIQGNFSWSSCYIQHMVMVVTRPQKWELSRRNKHVLYRTCQGFH